MTCQVCGKPKGRNKYTCSRACYAIWKTQHKTCVVCGKVFDDPQSNDTKTCSPECSHIHRRQLHADGVYDGTLEKAHEVAKYHPLTGRFETHINAKEWVIQAPDGQIYQCRNLLNWLRNHADMLDGTPQQAFDGITKIKYTMQGKRKNPSYQWKGWRLIDYGSSSPGGIAMEYKLKSGRVVTSDEWNKWIEEGKSMADIAELLNVPFNTADRIGYNFRYGGYGKFNQIKNSQLSGKEIDIPRKVEWIVKNPEGDEYSFTHLRTWARENAYLFSKTPEQIFAGFSLIKRSMEGRAKRPNFSYMGWMIKEIRELQDESVPFSHRLQSGEFVTIEDWKRWHNEGKTIEDICNMLGVTLKVAKTINSEFSSLGIGFRLPKATNPKKTKEPVEKRGQATNKLESGRIVTGAELMQLKEQGMTIKDIAEFLGVSERTVYRYMKPKRKKRHPGQPKREGIPYYKINKTGAKITADEWQKLRNNEMTNIDIAAYLDISPDSAAQMGVKFRKAGYDDPCCGKRHVTTKTCPGCGKPFKGRSTYCSNKCKDATKTERKKVVKTHFGRTIRAEEWQAWRDEGKTITEIANIVGTSPSCASYIDKKFRNAGVLNYGPTRPIKRIARKINELEQLVQYSPEALSLLDDLKKTLAVPEIKTLPQEEESEPAQDVSYIPVKTWADQNEKPLRMAQKALKKGLVPSAIKTGNPHGGVDVWMVPEGTPWPE